MEEDCPLEFRCPLTSACMVDPVMAADGFTYERSALKDWLLQRRTSPQNRQPLPHFNVYPNHEKKNQIAQWKADREDNFVQQQTLKEYFNKLTWATTSEEVIEELNNLSIFIQNSGMVVPSSQLGRLRGCLRADEAVWCPQVSDVLEALLARCKNVSGIISMKIETANAAAERANKTAEDVSESAIKLQKDLIDAESRVTQLKHELVDVGTAVRALRRVEGEYRGEVTKLQKTLVDCNPAEEPPKNDDGEPARAFASVSTTSTETVWLLCLARPFQF